MTELTDVATNIDRTDLNGEEIVDFDIDANDDYEIQSTVITDDDGRVIEAAVRFGRIPEPEGLLSVRDLSGAWKRMVTDVTGYDRLDTTAIEADLSDFEHVVPHLRIVREDVVEYDCDTLTLDEFVSAVVELSTLVERAFRADDDEALVEWL